MLGFFPIVQYFLGFRAYFFGELFSVLRDVLTNDPLRALVTYELPLASIVTDFYDKLKSLSSGYASLNYEHLDFRAGDLVKLDILVAAEPVDALSFIVHSSEARYVGSDLCS